MLAAGQVVDERYRVEELLGRGGMAEVFRATDTATDRWVALKVLHDRGPDNAVRFRSEAAALGRLDHPGLVGLRGCGMHDGLPYLVLDLADGPSLADELAAHGALGRERTVALGCDVADALAHIHREGVVHRDVKPANVLFDRSGRARLADFGIARVAGTPSLTRTGYVVGSAPYLAPEQVEARPVTAAADVFALGLVLLECLTGQRCYQGNQAEVVLSRLHRPPAVPHGLPGWLRAVLRAMTVRDPSHRPPADAVATALRRATSDPVGAATEPISHVPPAAHPRTARSAVHRTHPGLATRPGGPPRRPAAVAHRAVAHRAGAHRAGADRAGHDRRARPVGRAAACVAALGGLVVSAAWLTVADPGPPASQADPPATVPAADVAPAPASTAPPATAPSVASPPVALVSDATPASDPTPPATAPVVAPAPADQADRSAGGGAGQPSANASDRAHASAGKDGSPGAGAG
jgi:hypothetical protein